jgi:hypothetical protein
MGAREVTFGEFCSRLSAEDRAQVGEALRSGMGVARFGSMNLTYGKRGAVIEGLPPAAYGGSELGDFVAPIPTPPSKRSPLMDAVCRLPVTWDQLDAGFASDMGPPCLPVVGPP